MGHPSEPVGSGEYHVLVILWVQTWLLLPLIPLFSLCHLLCHCSAYSLMKQKRIPELYICSRRSCEDEMFPPTQAGRQAVAPETRTPPTVATVMLWNMWLTLSDSKQEACSLHLSWPLRWWIHSVDLYLHLYHCVLQTDIRPVVTEITDYSFMKIFGSDWLQNFFRLPMTNSKSCSAAMLVSSLPVDKMEQRFMSRVSQLTSRWLEQKCLHSGGGVCDHWNHKASSAKTFYKCSFRCGLLCL